MSITNHAEGFGTEKIGYGIIVVISVLIFINSIVSLAKHFRYRSRGEKLTAMAEKGSGVNKITQFSFKLFNCLVSINGEEKQLPLRVSITEPLYRQLTEGNESNVEAEVYILSDKPEEAVSKGYVRKRICQAFANILFFLVLAVLVTVFLIFND